MFCNTLYWLMVRCVHCPAQAGTPSWVPPMTLSSPSLSSFHQILFHLLYNFMILLILFYFLFATTAMAQSYSVLARDSHVMLHNRDPPEIIKNLKLLFVNCWKIFQIFFGPWLYFWRFPVQRDCKLHGAGSPDGLGVGGVLGGGGEGRPDQAGHTAQHRAVWYQHHVIRVICLVFAGVEVWMDA